MGDVPVNHFVPARVFPAVRVRVRLVDAVADADSRVRVHPGHSIVLCKFGLSNCDTQSSYSVCV
jgi:hypothetical protein